VEEDTDVPKTWPTGFSFTILFLKIVDRGKAGGFDSVVPNANSTEQAMIRIIQFHESDMGNPSSLDL